MNHNHTPYRLETQLSPLGKIVLWVKHLVTPQRLLAVIVLYHMISHLVWIGLNQAPPSWDEAHHIRRSIQYAQFIHSVAAGTPDYPWVADALQDGYGPLMRIVIGMWMSVMGTSVTQAQIVATICFGLTIVMVYRLTKLLTGEGYTAVVAATFFSFFQLIYSQTRWPLLDIPVTLFVLIGWYYLIRSRYGLVRRDIVIAAIAAAAACLTKAQSVTYFVIPAVFVLMHHSLHRSWSVKTVINLLIGVGVAGAIFGVWALPNYANMYQYVKAGAVIKLNHPYDLYALETWLFYLKQIINTTITPWGALLMLPAIYGCVRTVKLKYKSFIVCVGIGMYVWLSFLSNKDLRFLYPPLALMPIVFAAGWSYIFQKVQNNSLTRLVVISLLAFYMLWQLVMHISLSYGVLLPRTLQAGMNVPYLGDVSFINTKSDYPVKPYSKTRWPLSELAQDMDTYLTRNREIQVLFIPSFEYLNDNNVWMELTRIGNRSIRMRRGVEKVRFDSPTETTTYLEQFDHFFYVPKDFGPEWIWNKEQFRQMQAVLAKWILEGKVKIVRTYTLPDRQHVYWLERVKK